jgi:hypothetical protein
MPQFTRKHELGDSNIFRLGERTGVNTTSPGATLHVEGLPNAKLMDHGIPWWSAHLAGDFCGIGIFT